VCPSVTAVQVNCVDQIWPACALFYIRTEQSEHGENCGICMGEAIMAHNLHNRGVSASEIRKQIIAAYGRE